MKRKVFCLLISSLFIFGAIAFSLSASAQKKVVIKTRYISVAAIPGFPSNCNRVSVNIYKSGDSTVAIKARLVLVSGWSCGAAWFHYAASYLAREHNLEVWTLNRRQSMFEKRTQFEQLAQQLESGKLSYAIFQKKIRSLEKFIQAPKALLNKIGYKTSIADMHAVVLAAKKDGKPLFMGGWSDGVEFAMAYSLTRFADGKKRRAGNSFVKGLVLLDEDPEWGRYSAARMAQLAKATQSKIALGRNYEMRYPNVLFFEAAALFGKRINPVAEKFYRRPFRYFSFTGDALLGWLYDGGGYRSSWGWLFDAGSLIRKKEHIAWSDNGKTAISRVAGMHRAPGSVWEWFYPLQIAREYWQIGAHGFRMPEFSLFPDKKNRLPLFVAFSSMNRRYRKIPAGLRYYLRRTGIKDSQVTVLRCYQYKHGDILLSSQAEKDLWKPMATWLYRVLKF